MLLAPRSGVRLGLSANSRMTSISDVPDTSDEHVQTSTANCVRLFSVLNSSEAQWRSPMAKSIPQLPSRPPNGMLFALQYLILLLIEV